MYTLKILDTCSTITTLRLWHDLHVTKHIPHDFEDLLVKKKDMIYIGAIQNNEIQAIAQCKRLNLAQIEVKKIAHGPAHPEAASNLLKLLQEQNTRPDWNTIKYQPRWYCEELFIWLTLDSEET